MAEPRPRVFEYEVAYDGDGRRDRGGHDGRDARGAGRRSTSSSPRLLDCSLTSLRYHAEREEIDVDGERRGDGTVTDASRTGASRSSTSRRGSTCGSTPAPPDQRALLEKAERDCFVGASLAARAALRLERGVRDEAEHKGDSEAVGLGGGDVVRPEASSCSCSAGRSSSATP